jgi:hypothetical protein
MSWSTIELEPEVEGWLLSLTDDDFGRSNGRSTCLPMKASTSGEPFTRQLRGKLRELRFHLGRRQVRITYYIASGRRIVLLTVFATTRQQERAEIDRAWRAMQACIVEGHTAEDDA